MNYFNLVWLQYKFFVDSTNEFFYSYCKLFLTGTANYFLLVVLRIIFSLALTIIFHGIVNLFFGLQYIAGLRFEGDWLEYLPARFLRAIFVVSSFNTVLKIFGDG